jgi:26S proteasome regulatory subunit T5
MCRIKGKIGRIMKNINTLDSEIKRLKIINNWFILENQLLKEKIKVKQKNIDSSSNLPHLVATISEIFPKKNKKNPKALVLKTSNRLTIYVKDSEIYKNEEFGINNLVAVNRDNYYIIRKLPDEYDIRVTTMEIEQKPNQTYQDLGGLNLQIKELIEAIMLPITQPIIFKKLGIQPPKGVLLYGPPGTGKTLMARACAAQTNATFLKLAGPQMIQMFIGEGASLLREAFKLAREKEPSIIFIDEIDAIGTKRFGSESNGDREVQRTMLELLNQLDGFSPNRNLKIICATNRIDILDPALLRSGRIDRKIEFTLPDKKSRQQILNIHVRKLHISDQINLEKIAEITKDFNGAELKAVCIEAGMNVIRSSRKFIFQEDFIVAVNLMKLKKEDFGDYFY